MNRKLILSFFPVFFIITSMGGLISFRLFSTIDFNELNTTPPNHELWDALLKEFVDDGHVNYQRLLRNSEQLNIYLSRLQAQPPSATWRNEEKLAYWINAYNAFTLRLILDHYPIESIKDIGDMVQIPLVNSTWDISFIEIGDKKLSLNDIEHRILRKEFNEPRIHFAIVCAAKSCPPLSSEAFLAGKVDKQLNERAIAFINDNSKNHLAANHVEVSPIFDWFEGDFTKDGSLISYLNKYSHTKIDDNAKINYLDYDWSLND
jgi:uncharacterized protein DUF547